MKIVIVVIGMTIIVFVQRFPVVFTALSLVGFRWFAVIVSRFPILCDFPVFPILLIFLVFRVFRDFLVFLVFLIFLIPPFFPMFQRGETRAKRSVSGR